MKYLYCPKCGEYLEGGDGEMKDCLCGFKQQKTEDDNMIIDCIRFRWPDLKCWCPSCLTL